MRSLSPRAQEFQDFSEEELLDLYKRLRLFTYKRYGWLPHHLAGVDLDDLIQGAIADALTGVRQAHPDVPLFTFLCQTIRSKASHLWEKEKHFRRGNETSEAQDAVTLDHLLGGLPVENPLSSKTSGASDRQVFYNQLVKQILSLVENDALLTRIVELWVETPDLKPQEIARELGLPMEHLRKAQKRLRARVKFLKEVWSNG